MSIFLLIETELCKILSGMWNSCLRSLVKLLEGAAGQSVASRAYPHLVCHFFSPEVPLRYMTKQGLLYFYPDCLQSFSSTIYYLFACTMSRTFQGSTRI